jgi:hypothetical protein
MLQNTAKPHTSAGKKKLSSRMLQNTAKPHTSAGKKSCPLGCYSGHVIYLFSSMLVTLLLRNDNWLEECSGEVKILIPGVLQHHA